MHFASALCLACVGSLWREIVTKKGVVSPALPPLLYYLNSSIGTEFNHKIYIKQSSHLIKLCRGTWICYNISFPIHVFHMKHPISHRLVPRCYETQINLWLFCYLL